jgi:predicted GNAT family N-acyltransferase/precorrin-6B methylase 2
MSVAVVTLPVENEEERIFALLQRIGDGPRAVAEERLGFSELHENIMELENLVSHLDQNHENVRPILEGLTPKIIAGLNDTYRFWQTRLEFQFAHRLITGEASLSEYPFYERFDFLVRREIALLADTRPQRVLFIGSGSLPISAILMHLRTGLPVDCVVQDADAVPVSRQVVEKCGLSKLVRIQGSADAGCDVSDYDLVVVGILAQPKRAILKKLRKRCRPGCEILCRTSHGLRRLIYEATLDRDMRGFHIKTQQIAEGEQTVSTCRLEPAGYAAAEVRLEWLRGVDSQMASKIVRLMNRTLEEETTIGFPGPIDEETGRALMEQLGADVETGHRHVLIAEKDGAIVGQLILTPNSSPNHRHIVELTRGTIDPSFRGGGLSLRAFQEVAKKCDELGREVICLDVRAGTMAAMWWQHFGFKPYGLLIDYSRVGDKRYQGLYLTQTNAELKQRLLELAAAPGSNPTV